MALDGRREPEPPPSPARDDFVRAQPAAIVWETAPGPTARLAPELGEALGYPPHVWSEPGFALARVHEDDRPRLEAYLQTLGRERYAEIEYRLLAADDSPVWVRDAVSAHADEHGSMRLYGVTLDITGRKTRELEHERRLALLGAALESTAEGLLVIDERRQIVASNRKLAEMWEMPVSLLAPGPAEHALEFLLGRVADPAAFLAQANKPSSPKPHDEGDEIRLEDGRVFERYARPFVLEGRPVGVVVSCRDVTASRLAAARYQQVLARETAARAAAEESQLRAQILADDLGESLEQLQRAQEELLRRERLAALGELASVVAHEVRNALGASFNAVATLRRLVGAEGEVGVLLQIVQDEAKRLDRLVLDLLVFARPARGIFRYQIAAELVEDALLAARRATDRGEAVRVEQRFAEDLPPLWVDGGLVSLALTNVLTNALQAMADGGVLTIDAQLRVDGDRTFVELSIGDTGPGIPTDVLPHVFEPFFTTKALGTGLGLPIAKRLIEEQRGKIQVATEPGRGTTVTLLLPC